MLVSACLLGANCRYNAEPKAHEGVLELAELHELVPVCPEQLGGLPTPRPPAEIRDGRVMTRDGRDITENYERGAREALRLYRLLGCECALLKERSPSCGVCGVYDGSFTGSLREGMGVAAALLSENGIELYGETETEKLK